MYLRFNYIKKLVIKNILPELCVSINHGLAAILDIKQWSFLAVAIVCFIAFVKFIINNKFFHQIYDADILFFLFNFFIFLNNFQTYLYFTFIPSNIFIFEFFKIVSLINWKWTNETIFWSFLKSNNFHTINYIYWWKYKNTKLFEIIFIYC